MQRRGLASGLESARQAVETALAHPLRSGLGALAMAVGVATVAVVIAGVQGLSAFARATTARTFGADAFLVAQIASPGSLDRRALERKLSRNLPIRPSDLHFLERYSGEEVLYAPVVQRSADVVAGGRKLEAVSIVGTRAALADIRDLGVARGRFLTPDDETRAAPVAVIGSEVSETLYPGRDPLGLSLRLGLRRFTVVGVQGQLGTAGGASLDRSVYVPLAAFERVFGTPDTLPVFARARGDRTPELAESRARATLRARRRLRPGTPDNFDILSPEAARGFVARLTERVGAAAFPLSAMALLAAVVVVTNTTLVSVTERTREIGVRRALGATRAQVVREVLVESVLLALVGGTVGVLVVLAASAAVAASTQVPVTLTVGTIALSLGSAGLAGALAGLYPARRAAHVDIAQAVRAD